MPCLYVPETVSDDTHRLFFLISENRKTIIYHRLEMIIYANFHRSIETYAWKIPD